MPSTLAQTATILAVGRQPSGKSRAFSALDRAACAATASKVDGFGLTGLTVPMAFGQTPVLDTRSWGVAPGYGGRWPLAKCRSRRCKVCNFQNNHPALAPLPPADDGPGEESGPRFTGLSCSAYTEDGHIPGRWPRPGLPGVLDFNHQDTIGRRILRSSHYVT